jgi:hypothetical protein
MFKPHPVGDDGVGFCFWVVPTGLEILPTDSQRCRAGLTNSARFAGCPLVGLTKPHSRFPFADAVYLR